MNEPLSFKEKMVEQKQSLTNCEIITSELKSALISAIDAHNERSEFKVEYSDFFCGLQSIRIQGQYRKIDVEKVVSLWGEKVKEFTNLEFEVRAMYLSDRNNKTFYHKEYFNTHPDA